MNNSIKSICDQLSGIQSVLLEINFHLSKSPLDLTHQLDIVETAEYLKLSVRDIRQLIKQSKLHPIKKGKRLFFSEDEASLWHAFYFADYVPVGLSKKEGPNG